MKFLVQNKKNCEKFFKNNRSHVNLDTYVELEMILQKRFYPIMRKLMTKRKKKNRSSKNLCFSHRYTAHRTQLLIEQVQ